MLYYKLPSFGFDTKKIPAARSLPGIFIRKVYQSNLKPYFAERFFLLT